MIAMSMNREIEALKKRLARVAPIAKPPKLSMQCYQEGQGEPIDSPWVLNLEIESKPPLIENSPIQGEI